MLEFQIGYPAPHGTLSTPEGDTEGEGTKPSWEVAQALLGVASKHKSTKKIFLINIIKICKSIPKSNSWKEYKGRESRKESHYN